MTNGITYYRLKSDYEGALPPKQCGLTGQEIDNNFYVLEGRDVVSVTVADDAIVITLKNGDTISSGDVLSEYAKNLNFEFDPKTGTLYVKYGDEVKQEVTGFCKCDDSCCFTGVHTDGSILGKGTSDDPLSISPSFKPGAYPPAIGLIDKTEGGEIPGGEGLAVGTRYVVKDYINDYGMLYCYDGVVKICCELTDINSPWRIPTKEDWDDMLNAVEPIEEYRNHNKKRANKWFGKYAGKYLKSLHEVTDDGWNDKWKYEEVEEEPEDNCGHCCCDDDDPCRPRHCGDMGNCHQPVQPEVTPEGTDLFGFGVFPAGYAIPNAGDIDCQGFGTIARFWTSEVTCDRSVAYIKGFQWDKSKVYQDIVPTSHYYSLRLVKEYDGYNFFGREYILGKDYDTVLMPSLTSEKGYKVWTAVNFAVTGDDYCALVPGCGKEDLSDRIVYYIVEWNGREWISTPVGEGYTVTIINDGQPTDYHVIINPETGDAELVEKNYGTEEITADIEELKTDVAALIGRVEALENVVGEYDTEKGTIAERLDAIEAKIAEMAKNHDFGDTDNDGEWEPGSDEEIGDDSIIVNGKPW